MTVYQVTVRAQAEHIAEVDAASEDEALAVAERQGFERSDWYELSDFDAVAATEAPA